MNIVAAVPLDIEVWETGTIEPKLKGKITNQEMKTRVRTERIMETAGTDSAVPIKPKAPTSPEVGSERIQHSRFAGNNGISPRRHKVKSAPEANVHTQQGE